MSSRSHAKTWGCALVALTAASLLASSAAAQSVQLQLESRDVYAGLPFVLAVTADGFEEQPEPTVSDVEIPGCRVIPLGMTPNVSTTIQITNGVRRDFRQVTFVSRYRVEAERAGTYQIPPITVEQGDVRAETNPATIRVGEIESTRDMQLRLELPDRAVWLGETVEMAVDWYLRADVNDHDIIVPLFDQEEDVTVTAPPAQGARTLTFTAGARDIQLPFERSSEVLDGQQYTRFRFTALVTPQRVGTIEVPASRVVAQLQTGYGRDSFGFRSPRYQLFEAEDVPRQLEVRPLPLEGRPPSFSGAVGSGFSLDVEADRTVVRLGEPIELTITVRGDGVLSGLALPPLDTDDQLPPGHFSVPDEQPVGDILADGSAKRFHVVVRVQSTEVREIPSLAFSYFDPERAEYVTARSDPVALSVAGSAVVRADDVVVSQVASEARRGEEAATGEVAVTSLVGADLSLSEEDQTLRRALQIRHVWPILAGLYLLPLLVLAGREWHLRTRARRGERAELRRAHQAIRQQLGRAAKQPARESAPQVVAALQALARRVPGVTGEDGGVIEQLENEAFDPVAGSSPLSEDLRAKARSLADRWLAEGQSGPSGGGGTPLALLLLAAVTALFPAPARGQDDASELQVARQAYASALGEVDRAQQLSLFETARDVFGSLVDRYPDRPELLTDWGNAALGARDLGVATLAYRRALHYDDTLSRARKNLDWVRERQPSWLPRPPTESTLQSLFFWRHTLTPADAAVLAAVFFALAVLLVVPWRASPARRRGLRYLAVFPAVIWAVLLGAQAFEADDASDAVVVQSDAILRSADSVGAPATLATPLPAGAELAVDETREGWTRVTLSNGATGWLPAGAIQMVTADGNPG